MSNSRSKWDEFIAGTIVTGASTVGTALGAKLLGNSVWESTSVSTPGIAFLSAGLGLFSAYYPSQRILSDLEAFVGFEVVNAAGTGLGMTAEWFLKAATSTIPLESNTAGYIFTFGLLYCAKEIMKQQMQNTEASTPKFHKR